MKYEYIITNGGGGGGGERELAMCIDQLAYTNN